MRWVILLLPLLLLTVACGSSPQDTTTPSPNAEAAIEVTPTVTVEALDALTRQWASLLTDLYPTACRDRDYAYDAVASRPHPIGATEEIAEDVRNLIQYCREKGVWLGD